jgi:hypothetical protein
MKNHGGMAHPRYARRVDNRKSRSEDAACSIKSLLLVLLLMAAGYYAWLHWPTSSDRDQTGGTSTGPTSGTTSLQSQGPTSPLADSPIDRQEEIPGLPALSATLDPGVKSTVRRMFEEWKRRYVSTERKVHGAMTYDLGEVLAELKKRGLYTEQVLFREIERALRALGVPADQSTEVSLSILEHAKLDGQRAKQQSSHSLR